MLTAWQEAAAFAAGLALPASLGLQIRIWTQCRPRGTPAQQRAFRVTFAVPWRFCSHALLASPLLALLAWGIGQHWFSDQVGSSLKDYAAIWVLIAAASLIFLVKAACASVLLGVTLMTLISAFALHERIHLHSLYEMVFNVIIDHSGEPLIVLCMALTLVYSLFSVASTLFSRGYEAAGDVACSLIDR